MRTYNVILHKGVDYQSFWDDMERDDDGGKLYIPNRRVDSPNLRPNSPRQTWYTLSDEEADIVRNDERVLAVEIPPEFRDDIIIAPRITQTGDFTKTTSDSGAYLNWGLIRSNSKTNNYGTGTTTSENYLYTLDGTGVDIVIQDSGLQADHPEFESEPGQYRIVDIDWGSYSDGAFTQNANHNRDYDGHGTHCGGIAAGKTYGWAKGASIYSQKIYGLEGSGDDSPRTGILPTYAFDAIKNWHNAKPINPNTGYKTPTVVNMSWGYLTTLTNATITNINYRGTDYTGAQIDSTTEREQNFGLMYSLYSSGVYAANLRIVGVDTDIEELLEAGVHVCVAAGNRSNKIDEVGGDDYDNNYTSGGSTNYYHRGSSPYGDAGNDGSPRAIIVGNMDSTSASATNDQKVQSSECGPGVDIYAPGTNIMSCTSTTNKWGSGSQNYYLNSSYRQTNISGTSMASPQVVGVLALYLQMNPGTSPAQAKEWLLNNAGSAILNTGTGNDWTNDRSLKGGEATVLFNKFNKAQPITIQNPPTNFFSGGVQITTK